MPIYEYRCTTCGFQQEYLQKMNDTPLTDCPECSKPSLSKMVSAAGFHLKGSGWYATDFKNAAKPRPDAKREDKSATKAEDKQAAKAEAKPAAKAKDKSTPAAPAQKSDGTRTTARSGVAGST